MNEIRVTIGEAAAQTGLTAKAIRLYERRGLLAPAPRTEAGYRTYGDDELAVLTFIRQARAVGLRLDEIRRVLDLQRLGEQPCATVLDLLDERLAEIDETIADLQALRHTMAAARGRADDAARDGADAVVCRLIEFDGRLAP